MWKRDASSRERLFLNARIRAATNIDHTYFVGSDGLLVHNACLKNFKHLHTTSAEEYNKVFAGVPGARYYKSAAEPGFPPFKPNTLVYRGELDRSEQFVRLHDGFEKKAGGWLVKADSIQGLTPKQIQAKFQLGFEPKFVTTVNVPAGTKIAYGSVNPGYPGAPGPFLSRAARQYYIEDEIDRSLFTNTRRL